MREAMEKARDRKKMERELLVYRILVNMLGIQLWIGIRDFGELELGEEMFWIRQLVLLPAAVYVLWWDVQWLRKVERLYWNGIYWCLIIIVFAALFWGRQQILADWKKVVWGLWN